MGIGICAKTSAEYTKRGENFSNELDFVLANVIMALVADFMLVWLPAPTFSSVCAFASEYFLLMVLNSKHDSKGILRLCTPPL